MTSFESAAAATYEVGRPRYPVAFVEEVLLGIVHRGSTLVDVGAGSGLLTASLRSSGFEVIPVEPDAHMRAQSRVGAIRPGTAESLPLADQSVDAVVCGQALHYFQLGAARAEFRRVARCNRLVAFSNEPRPGAIDVVWQSIRANLHDGRRQAPTSASFSSELGPASVFRFDHDESYDTERIVHMLKSLSPFQRATADVQEAMIVTVRDQWPRQSTQVGFTCTARVWDIS